MATHKFNEWRTWYVALVQLDGERVLRQCGERVPIEAMLVLGGILVKETVTLDVTEPGTWQIALFETETSDKPMWLLDRQLKQFEQAVIQPVDEPTHPGHPPMATDYSRVSVTLSDTEPEPPADTHTSASLAFPVGAVTICRDCIHKASKAGFALGDEPLYPRNEWRCLKVETDCVTGMQMLPICSEKNTGACPDFRRVPIGHHAIPEED